MDLGIVEAVEQPAHRVPIAMSDDSVVGVEPRGRHISALLVEDDLVDARLIALIATSMKNYRVEIVRAASSAEAQALLKTRTFNICILDYWLGCESVLRFLSDLGISHAAVPAIILTNFATSDIRRLCGDLGAIHFLSKGNLSAESIEHSIDVALAVLDENPERH